MKNIPFLQLISEKLKQTIKNQLWIILVTIQVL